MSPVYFVTRIVAEMGASGVRGERGRDRWPPPPGLGVPGPLSEIYSDTVDFLQQNHGGRPGPRRSGINRQQRASEAASS